MNCFHRDIVIQSSNTFLVAVVFVVFVVSLANIRILNFNTGSGCSKTGQCLNQEFKVTRGVNFSFINIFSSLVKFKSESKILKRNRKHC